ncbi:NfeD family protein [Venatoribacter cucullus]|uniref:NfeD family protein n=1 Tax=Venatoribacter cucullus TaxID=2661630 RepID=A0A9E8JNQ9_9GAMM|nr:NfeD family protein [Venatoribacter cucullus]QQD20533.1 NfeD family protein [Oceanospirillaceae bacterium ASx5O]QQD23236.1 NfeD family protein [Venatoribacter cucullus]UZK02670.1 NfeD family protein [Venatoribacter cucullus]
MEFILQHLPKFLLVVGVGALIIEVAILGFATFVLLFLGASLVITGLLMHIGLLPATMMVALWSNALLTSILALVLWKPLRNLQNNHIQRQPVENDFTRHEFVLEQDADVQGKTEHQYSGVRWKVKSEQPLAAGTRVEVVKADVGVLWVKEKA